MLKSYFKIAWRSLMKNKVFSFINVFGLAVGLTTFLLVALYIYDELTFDSFHKNAKNLYRVVEVNRSPEGKETKIAGAGFQLTEKVRSDFHEIKDVVRLLTFSRTNVSTIENANVFYDNFTIANPGFLTTFDFDVLQGDRKTALTAPHSVIVTEETAKKLFNTTDVLGKAIKVDRDTGLFNITAVIKKAPVNSHLTFNLLFSESTINDIDFKKFVQSDWTSGSFTSYFLLDNKADVRQTQAKINELAEANNSDNTKGKNLFQLQPLQDIHFYSNDIEGESGVKGNVTNIYVFSIIALFVLVIASINYMNLTTARFSNRAKEIAIRKVAGASRKTLIGQFLSEAFLVAFIALLIALAAVQVLLPFFNAFTNKELTLGTQTDFHIWLGIAAIIILVAFLSGIYPALFQSRSHPLLLLKNKINTGWGFLSIRKSLVVFQFALSIIMIMATIVVYLQMKYVSKKDMGFNKEQLLVVDINSGKIRKSAATIKTEFEKLPQVKQVSVSSRVPGEWKDLPKVKVRNEQNATSEGGDIYFLGVDDAFLKTYQITLIKGRNFAAGSLADSSAVIINETAAKELGIIEPTEQIVEVPLEQIFRARVIGIVKDFNFQSLHQPLAPMILAFQQNPVQSIDYFTARVSTSTTPQTLERMNAILKSIDQNHLFEYHFLDKQWDLFYEQDQIRQVIFLIVAVLTIIIACLGLFGLATYAAEQRIKEIGIRKVLGASVGSIVAMLSRDFIRLVFIAAIVACPVAWSMMNQWLNDFAYKIDIQWWMFALAALVAVVIALTTISFRSVKAATANPVKSLRSE